MIDGNIKRKCTYIILYICIVLANGCQHKPVYPDIGSIYISTDPDKAEVLLDGNMMHMITPVKIDGIPVGSHELTVRHFNYKTIKMPVEVKPGQTRRIYQNIPRITLDRKDTLTINASDMCLCRETGEIFLSQRGADEIVVARIDDVGQITVSDRITAGNPQWLVAANRACNMLFFANSIPWSNEQEITAFDLTAKRIVRKIYLKDIRYYSTLIFSPDGNLLVAADSLNKRLMLIDPRLCSVIDSLDVPGYPTDVCFDVNCPDRVYVTLSGSNRFIHLNLENGEVLRSLDTGNSPGAIFWDKDCRNIGFSSRTDITYTLVNVDTWVCATSNSEAAGDFVFGVCATPSSDYLLSAGDMMLQIIYLPTWQVAAKIFNGFGQGTFLLIKIMLAKDGEHLLMLNTEQFITVKLDF
jgi:hypothetical protein